MDPNVEGDRGSMLVRFASQSSLDESSQRAAGSAAGGAAGGAGEGGGAARGGGEGHAGSLLCALAALRRERALCDVLLCARADTPPSPPSPLDTRAPACTADSTDKTSSSDTESDSQTESEAGGAERGGAERGGAERGGAATAAVPAHRAVLAACSPYFRAMFTQFDERTMHTITIQKVDPAALEAIVEYIYSPDSLRVSEDNVQALLSAASLLQVGGVRAACCLFLAAALAPDNALGIRAFADMHACGDLALTAQRYVERHFLRVAQHDEFLALDVPALCALLASDALVTGGEEAVLEAALRWVRHDERARLPHTAAVLERVRLPLLPHETLVAAAQQPPLRSAAVAVKDLIIEALSFHLLRPSRRLAAAQALPRARPRHTPHKPKMLLVVGGQAPKAIRDVEAYDLQAERWAPCRELLTRRCRAGLAMLDGKVYAVGGFNGTLRVRSVDVYCPARDAWTPGPALCARRSTLGVAVLDQRIYAVGGFDGATGLSSAEVLEGGAEGGAWRYIADMSTRRSSVGVAALEGCVYAVGGYDGATRQCLASVERYEPRADRWDPVEPMSARRSGCGVGVAAGALWAIGGHDGPAVRRSVERYSPRDGWSGAPAMRSARRNAAVLSHEGRLYVVGGDDGATNLSTVEVFDPAAEQWTELPQRMSLGRSYAGVVLVERAD